MPSTSTSRSRKQTALTDALADLVLTDGLDALSLRPAAARLGTSDRMLLYYFGTKTELVAAVLRCLSLRMAGLLAQFAPTERLSPENMLVQAATRLADADMRPFMVVWTEITARAARGDALFRQVAENGSRFWNEWVQARTAFPPSVVPEDGAAVLLAVLEGLTTLALIGAPVSARSIPTLARLFQADAPSGKKE